MESGKSNEFSKDTVYRFLNSPNFNWRKFLLLLSSSIIKNIIAPLTSEDRVNVLIVDDSLYSRLGVNLLNCLQEFVTMLTIDMLKAFAYLLLDGQMVTLFYHLLSLSFLPKRRKRDFAQKIMQLIKEPMVLNSVRRLFLKRLRL